MNPERGVLRGHLEWIGIHLVDALVDPGYVGEDVELRAPPRRAVARRQRVELRVELLGGEVLVGELVGVAGRRARPGQLGQVALGGVTYCVHEEEAFLRGRVAGAEHQVGPLVAIDVGHAELLVPEDLDPGPR